MSTPQPLPYQGSKRRLAPAILARFPREVDRLVEPFAGSAAVSLAAADAGRARRFLLGDVLAPLSSLWAKILSDPEGLAAAYAALWEAQRVDSRGHYDAVRRAFNAEGGVARLLYLLNRCVKGAVRFNRAGAFNQGPDNRRLGARPAVVRARLRAAHDLLAGRAMTQGSANRRECGLEGTVNFRGATKRPGAPIGRGGGGASAMRGRASPPAKKGRRWSSCRPNGRNEGHSRPGAPRCGRRTTPS